MRFLVDNALSPRLSAGLSAAGHDSVHVRDRGLAGATDEVIFDLAAAEARILVSADTDFGTLHAQRNSTSPSLILYRHHVRRMQDQLALILANLSSIESDLENGSVVVIESARVRVRRLPISG